MDKRDRIVAAAAGRFLHYGIQKTTMQEVADEAGVAVGTLYRYFKDKDDLLAACTEGFGEEHRRQSAEFLASASTPEEKLRGYIVARYRRNREVGTGARHAAEVARAVIRLRPERLREEVALMRQTVEAFLSEGIGIGVFDCHDAVRDAEVFLLSVAAFFPNASMGLAEWPSEEKLLAVVDWFVEVWRRGGAAGLGRGRKHACDSQTQGG